jgi:hypothetical protein
VIAGCNHFRRFLIATSNRLGIMKLERFSAGSSLSARLRVAKYSSGFSLKV